MTRKQPVTLRKLPTGVPRLDEVLGGGVPEYSVNLICGAAGAGKTTLAQQILFANASTERPALYFTVLGEPTLKMLRYQQQFTFFDADLVDGAVRFINLSDVALTGDLESVLHAIAAALETFSPSLVFLDSFGALLRSSRPREAGGTDPSDFAQRLALQLTSWQATTFLVAEYEKEDAKQNPIFAVADGILSLSQAVIRNSMVRKLEVLKMRGQAPQPGLHTVRVVESGIEVFPRLLRPIEREPTGSARLISTGVAGLDEMLGGGTFSGSSILVAGPSGAGKSILCLQLVAEGVRCGEPGVIVLFEEATPKYLQQSLSVGVDLEEAVRSGKVELLYLRPQDLSVEETLYAIESAVARVGAKRVVIDSISGFEAALAPSFQDDFRESLYRLIGALTAADITVMMTVENTDSYHELKFTPHAVSFISHDVILQRYVEIRGRLERLMTVIKTRGRPHSLDLRRYRIGPEGIVMGAALREYRGVLSGIPRKVAGRRRRTRAQADPEIAATKRTKPRRR
jgi:circadian clock protein KaiC